MFFGEFEYNIDAKWRIPIPPRFRKFYKDGVVLAPSAETCIVVYPISEWKKLAAALSGSPLTPNKMRKLNRAIFAPAFSIDIDSQGRVTLPAPLRTYASLDDEVAIIGANNYLEIWSKAKWSEEKVNSQEQAWQIIESLEHKKR